VYFNFILRGFYHCKDDVVFRMRLPGNTAAYHKQAWATMDAKVAPLVSRVPPAQRVKEALAKWFTG
jgi:hypothetical protein